MDRFSLNVTPESRRFIQRVVVFSFTGGILGVAIGSIIDHWDRLRHLGHRALLLTRSIFDPEWHEWRRLRPLTEARDHFDDVEHEDMSLEKTCNVCHDLVFWTPHRVESDYKWAFNPDAGGLADKHCTDRSPCYPLLHEWVQSAMEGCISCQIVVDALAAFDSKLFDGYNPRDDGFGLPKVHIRAIFNGDRPLSVIVVRPWYDWFNQREEILEVFTQIGT